MNKQVHRLVFDRRRGMRVPAAEHVRSAGKAGGGESRAVARAAQALVATMAAAGPVALGLIPDAADAQTRTMVNNVTRAASVTAMTPPPQRNLPWASSQIGLSDTDLKKNQGSFLIGDYSQAIASRQLDITQFSAKGILNWDSFNIGQGYTVKFIQPNASASVLNNIWDNNPSVILGQIQANGEVILQNHNGVIFGPTARVDTARFVTTALKLANDTYNKGIRNERQGNAVFGDDESLPTGFITIERGAEIKALAGGDVLMIAPKVYNEGTIETPKGQTVLAAGQKVYLYNSVDPAQRGLVVAVDSFADSSNDVNTVEQAAAGSYVNSAGQSVLNHIKAEQGTVNLVGMTVRQNGVISATTAVKGQNGAIYLQAQKSATPYISPGNSAIDSTAAPKGGNELGTVELGKGSITEVTPESASGATQKDAEAYYRSKIDIRGKDVRVRAGSTVRATSGNINILAASDTQNPVMAQGVGFDSDDSHLVIESGALIDASGQKNVKLQMSRNQIDGRLFQIELADSPVQRGGVLYRQEVLANANRQISVANVTGQYNLIERTAEELSTRGGNVRIESLGSTVLSDGAKIDISGGSVSYSAGAVSSSFLRKGNQLIAIENAKADVKYDELLAPTDQVGQTKIDGYVQGADAGTLIIGGTRTYVGSDIKAGVVVGANQRSGQTNQGYVSSMDASNDLTEGTDELGRSKTLLKRPDLYGQLLPARGKVTIGRVKDNHLVLGQEIDLVASKSAKVDAIPEVDAQGADAYFDQFGSTQIGADMLAAGQVGQLVLNARQVSLERGVALDLGAVGSLSVSAQHIDVGARIAAAGGGIALNTFAGGDGNIDVLSGAKLDVSGSMLDERGTPFSAQPIRVDGGTVSLVAGNSLNLQEGSELDVSAGAWRSAAGSTVLGKAGAIALTVNDQLVAQQPRGTLALNGVMSAFDFKSGGALSVSGIKTLTYGAGASDGGLTIGSGLFTDDGFGSISLSALGDVKVADGATLAPKMKNLVLQPSRTASGNDMTSIQLLEAGVREGVKLTLTAKLKPNDALLNEELRSGGSLYIGKGALIDSGIGGSVNLTAGYRADVYGTVRAKGGGINVSLLGSHGSTGLEVTPESDGVGFVADQAIRLHDGSLLDASGVAKTVTTSSAAGTFVTGKVLGGGTVKLNVRSDGNAKGAVIAEAGSTIDVSGAAGDLDLGRTPGKTHLSAGAGTVEVASADGIQLAGTLKANRPDATVSGGQIKVDLSTNGYSDVVAGPDVPTYSTAERRLTVLGSAVDVASYGAHVNEAVVSADGMLSAGFDRIELRSDDKITLGSGVNLAANSALAGSIPLRSLILNSPVLAAEDAQRHVLQASYVSLGNRDLKPEPGITAYPVPGAAKGDAGLTVNAGLIELYGYSALQGFGSASTPDAKVALNATLSAQNLVGQRQDGEVRLVGTSFNNTDKLLLGQLNFAGDLSITAGQTYATTLTQFDVHGLEGDSTLSTLQPANGSTSKTPLSAFGQLTLSAYDIHHAGVVRQPFGSVALKAENNAFLADGSVLSVTGNGVNVPVGTTINGAQWFYDTQGTVFGDGNAQDASANTAILKLDGVPVGKGVLVKGKGLTLASQAGVQAQAGGDVLAWEFSAGVGGSTDTLNRPNVFAILPGYTYDFAPNDAEINASTKAVGANLSAGDQVDVLTGSSVLAAGRYTLLPARYAVLPGAVLVSAAALKTPTKLTAALQNSDDGSVLVSGYKTSVGTQINGGNDQRLALNLEPESTFRAKSTLTVTSVNDYLTTAAQSLHKPIPTLPGDAGRASLSAQSNFDWAAQFNLDGGELDLSMPKMEVVADGQSAQEGYAAITSAQLNATGASSILLGGVRSGARDHVTIDTKSTDVSIASSLSGGEWLAVASNTVDVKSGVSIVATGSKNAAHELALSGNGAALLVSNVEQVDLTRTLSGTDGSVAQGTLNLGTGSRVAGASVEMDGVKQLTISDLAHIDSQSVGLGAPHIILGAAAQDESALSVQGALLQQLNTTKSVKLHSYSSIDFAGSAMLGLQGEDHTLLMDKLVLDAPELRGLGVAEDTVTIQAKDLVWRNTSGLTAAGQASDAQLVMRAQPPLRDTETGGLTLGEGSKQLTFAKATLQSQGDAILSGQGNLNARGNLTIQAARLTADAGASQALISQSVLTIAQQADAHTLNERRGAAASVSLTGQRVIQDGTIDLPSGQLAITGTGQAGQDDTVVLTDRSKTQAAGWTQKAGANWSVTAPGGDIQITAQQGDVVLNGQLDVSAPVPASDSDTAKAAGQVSLSALGTEGKLSTVRVGKQAQIKGSAASDKLSGSLRVDAQRVADEGEASTSGGTLDRLVKASQSGGMHREVNVRVRQGDQSLNTAIQAQRVNLSADGGSLTLMNQGNIDATAPQGGVISLAARDDVVVNASSVKADSARAGANGGDILISSTNGFVRLENESTEISAKGDDAMDGRVVLRAQRHDDAEADLDRVNIKPIKAHITAGEVNVEAVRVYQGDTLAPGKTGSVYTETVTTVTNKVVTSVNKATTTVTTTPTTATEVRTYVDGVLDESLTTFDRKIGTAVRAVSATAPGAKLGTTTILAAPVSQDTVVSEIQSQVGLDDVVAQAGSFMAHKDDVQTALALADHVTGNAHVRMGTEVRSAGSFTLNSDLSMPDALHVGGEPMSLTIRAAKDVIFNGSLSDGFDGAGRSTASATAILPGDAGSFRIVAGADMNAADLMRTQAGAGGNLTVAAGKLIRTTSGSIELAAANNIELKTNYSGTNRSPVQASVYVAGRLAELADGQDFTNPSDSWGQFTDHGGRLELTAGKDIISPAAAQAFANWFYHTANSADPDGVVPINAAWWSSFDAFKQGVGSFGGGNVDIRAGGSINNLTVVAPTSARTVDGVLTVSNGGDIHIHAGGDIKGGNVFAGKGVATMVAGGAFTVGDTLDLSKVPTLALNVGLMDAQVNLQSTGELNVGMIFNPTIWQSATRVSSAAAEFFTYGDNSALAATSLQSDVNWRAGDANLTYVQNIGKSFSVASEQVGTAPAQVTLPLTLVAPTSLRFSALSEDVNIGLTSGSVNYMYPSASGNLAVYAAGNLNFANSATSSLVVGHAEVDQMPSLLNPAVDGRLIAQKSLILDSLKQMPTGLSNMPSSDLHALDTEPVRLYAGDAINSSANTQLNLPKRFEIEAGGDINNLSVVAEQFHDTDTSSIVAGGNFNGTANPPGPNRKNGLIQLSGPGQLLVSAGLQMNLSSSRGVETVGQNFNGALPDVAAKVRLAAGMAKTVALSDFQDRYLNSDPQAQQDLVAYVQSVLAVGAEKVTGYAQAWNLYQQMTPPHQTAIANAVINRAFVKAFLAPGAAYADQWETAAKAAGVSTTDYSSDAFRRMKDEVVMAEIKRVGTLAVAIHDTTDAKENAVRAAQREALWSTVADTLSLAGLGQGFKFDGDINIAGSKVYTNAPGGLTTGGIDLWAPGGQVIVGLSTLSENDNKQKATRGLVTALGGSIRSVSEGDFQVNAQKAFVVGEGDLMVYAGEGNIDSGRGSNTDVTIPKPVIKPDPQGNLVVSTPAATTGSGIGILKAGDIPTKGTVNLYAPHGEILALDAFIRNEGGGDINVAGPVKGADNLKGAVSGLAPVVVATPAISVPSALPNDSTQAAAAETAQEKKKKEPNSMVTVDLLGMGEEALPPTAAGVKADDAKKPDECKKLDESKKDAGRGKGQKESDGHC
ncbi:MAG: filamentous hemagglutinin N-terminal domain-containing protein [Acidobacteriota bacterium]